MVTGPPDQAQGAAARPPRIHRALQRQAPHRTLVLDSPDGREPEQKPGTTATVVSRPELGGAHARVRVDELFGPNLVVAPFASEAQAYEVANAVPCALTGGVRCVTFLHPRGEWRPEFVPSQAARAAGLGKSWRGSSDLHDKAPWARTGGGLIHSFRQATRSLPDRRASARSFGGTAERHRTGSTSPALARASVPASSHHGSNGGTSWKKSIPKTSPGSA